MLQLYMTGNLYYSCKHLYALFPVESQSGLILLWKTRLQNTSFTVTIATQHQTTKSFFFTIRSAERYATFEIH